MAMILHPQKKIDRRSHGFSDFPSTQSTPITSAGFETDNTSTKDTPLPDASSSNTTAKMFCCGKHLNSSSHSKRDVNLSQGICSPYRTFTRHLQPLLKIRTMDKDPGINSSSGIPDFTVLDQQEFKDSPLKSFFEHTIPDVTNRPFVSFRCYQLSLEKQYHWKMKESKQLHI